MNLRSKAILLALLLAVLQAQTTPQTNTTYTLNQQQYVYIYGSGSAQNGNAGDRPDGNSNTFVADSTYVPPATSADPRTIICPQNQVYNNILCQCVCLRGYYMGPKGSCLAFDPRNPVCGKNEVYADQRCQCAQGFSLIDTYCGVCPPYSTYNLNSLSCQCALGYSLVQGECRLPYVPPTPPTPPSTPTCGLNQQLVNGICSCLTNFYLVKGVCSYCVSPNYYDAQLAICRPTCQANQQLDLASLSCVCIGGFQNINGSCGTCPAYSVYNRNSKACDCIEGYTFSSGLCIPKTTPPVPTTPLPNSPSPCSDNNAYLFEGQCICRSTYYKIGGICQQCPVNTFYDATLVVCRPPCQVNEAYNITTGSCTCAPNYFRIKGVCTRCGSNSTYDSGSQTCVCPSGFRLDAAGNCIVGCGVNEVLNNGQCCCKVGFYPVNGICGQCAWNEVYDQGLGICRVPCDYKRIYDISVQKCVCLPQYYEMADGTCDICVLHSTYDSLTKSCPCDKGYIKNLGLCTTACNAYESYVNGSCLCKTGYYLIGYSCGLCPPTQVYDATYRICHTPCQQNEVWDATIRACRCQPAYYLIQGVCSQCDSRSQVYDQKTQCCVCNEGYQKAPGQGCQGVCSPICSATEDYINGRCVCKPGFYLINNFCVQCPDGQYYDIYQRVCRVKCGTNEVYNFNTQKCDCAQGFYLVQGICNQCQAGQTYNSYSQTCSITPCPGVNEFFSNTTQTCICQPQYVRIRGVCTNCNPGQYYDSYSDRCLCKPGYTENNGFCIAQCPTGSTYVNGKCLCDNGQDFVNGVCRTVSLCPLNSHYDKLAECCLCDAGFRVINGQCSNYQYCGLNGYLKYGQCYCNQGYYWILSACRPCAANEAFNGVACECFLGYVRDNNDVCVVSTTTPNCYQNERYDVTLKACVCVQGAQYIRGKCETIPKCPANAEYNSVRCVCSAGYQPDNQGNCVKTVVPTPTCPSNSYFNGVFCSCNTGVFQVDTFSCGSCPNGTQWNGITCASVPPQTCASGFVFNDGTKQCEPEQPSCGANAYFNGAVCVCFSGYNLINNVCQQCPANTTFDGQTCASNGVNPPPSPTCGSNQISVGGACVCNSGLYLINGQCLACPAYTSWNGKYCQCGCDTSAWCLGQPFSVWDNTNKICNCAAGYTRVNGICSSQP
jgi:hypothetical protein